MLSDAVMEVNADVDKWDSDGFRDLVTDKGGFSGNFITRVGREEATEGAEGLFCCGKWVGLNSRD